jgi:sugar phosphate isomerase/epimerase
MMRSNQPLLPRVSLSIYSFGYSAGFIKDSRPGSSKYQNLDPLGIAKLAKKMGLGGIELPIDKYFPNPQKSGLPAFIDKVGDLGLKMYFDLETFDSAYVKGVAGLISDHSTFLRAKVSTFYGGNRFKYKELYLQDVERITREIDETLTTLKNNNLKVLIENHQDIVLDDIEALVSRFGGEVIGVNWDIGNSLPSGETIKSFISKARKYIGNVHLKDYLIYWCKEGYILRRCALGKGFVDFNYCVNNLDQSVPLTIELGPLVGRKAEINHPEYWEQTHGISDSQRQEFMKFIEVNVISGDHRSAWELKLSPEEISNSELSEMIESVDYLKTIL